MLQIAQFYAHHMLGSTVRHSHQAVLLPAVHNLQPDVSGVRNTADESHRERYHINTVPFGFEPVGPGKPRADIYDALMDVRCHHQTAALSNINGRNDIIGKF